VLEGSSQVAIASRRGSVCLKVGGAAQLLSLSAAGEIARELSRYLQSRLNSRAT
jgi:hypothetical protein